MANAHPIGVDPYRAPHAELDHHPDLQPHDLSREYQQIVVQTLALGVLSSAVAFAGCAYLVPWIWSIQMSSTTTLMISIGAAAYTMLFSSLSSLDALNHQPHHINEQCVELEENPLADLPQMQFTKVPLFKELKDTNKDQLMATVRKTCNEFRRIHGKDLMAKADYVPYRFQGIDIRHLQRSQLYQVGLRRFNPAIKLSTLHKDFSGINGATDLGVSDCFLERLQTLSKGRFQYARSDIMASSQNLEIKRVVSSCLNEIDVTQADVVTIPRFVKAGKHGRKRVHIASCILDLRAFKAQKGPIKIKYYDSLGYDFQEDAREFCTELKAQLIQEFNLIEQRREKINRELTSLWRPSSVAACNHELEYLDRLKSLRSTVPYDYLDDRNFQVLFPTFESRDRIDVVDKNGVPIQSSGSSHCLFYVLGYTLHNINQQPLYKRGKPAFQDEDFVQIRPNIGSLLFQMYRDPSTLSIA